MQVMELHQDLLAGFPEQPSISDVAHAVESLAGIQLPELKKLYYYGTETLIGAIEPDIPYIDEPFGQDAASYLTPHITRYIQRGEYDDSKGRVRHAYTVGGSACLEPVCEAVSSQVSLPQLYLDSALRLLVKDRDSEQIQAMMTNLANGDNQALYRQLASSVLANNALLGGAYFVVSELVRRNPEIELVTSLSDVDIFNTTSSPEFVKAVIRAAGLSFVDFNHAYNGNGLLVGSHELPESIEAGKQAQRRHPVNNETWGSIREGCPAIKYERLMRWAPNFLLTNYFLLSIVEQQIGFEDTFMTTNPLQG